MMLISISYCKVSSTIKLIFSEFLTFCRLLKAHEIASKFEKEENIGHIERGKRAITRLLLTHEYLCLYFREAATQQIFISMIVIMNW